MLTYYLTQTRALLQNPSAPTTLYTDADLTRYINQIRGQLAGDAQCIRILGLMSTVVGQPAYQFSSINVSAAGISGVLNVQNIQYEVATGQKWVTGRSWEWYQLYNNNNPVPSSGPPKTWAQLGQGGSAQMQGSGPSRSGYFYIDPIPDKIYVLVLDCVCFPIALTQDSDPEAIPYEFTEAIPFGAAWYALLSSQTSARMAEAERYLNYYQQYTGRARNWANPDVLKYQFEQQANVALPNVLGISQKGQQ